MTSTSSPREMGQVAKQADLAAIVRGQGSCIHSRKLFHGPLAKLPSTGSGASERAGSISQLGREPRGTKDGHQGRPARQEPGGPARPVGDSRKAISPEVRSGLTTSVTVGPP
jgi:hypothetical protein